jgi:GTP pyrophosphokinase
MVRRNKEFNEIYDLAGLRVVVDSVRDCYGTLGVIHSTWKPIPGRVKDYIAMPKFNMYQSLHTTVMSHEGKLLEIQIRTREMDVTAEYGIAAHWIYKHGLKDSQVDRLTWLKSMMEWQKETTDAAEFMESLKGELLAEEVYVFTPKGDVMAGTPPRARRPTTASCPWTPSLSPAIASRSSTARRRNPAETGWR